MTMDEGASGVSKKEGGSARTIRIAAVIAAVAGLALLGRAAMRSSEQPRSPTGLQSASAFVPVPSAPPVASAGKFEWQEQEAPPSAEVRELLGPIQPGATAGEWKVSSVFVPLEGDMVRSAAVRVERAGATFTVWIASKGTHGFRPRLESELYAFYYGAKVPPEQRTTDAEIDGVLQAILTAVKQNEGRVLLPPEL